MRLGHDANWHLKRAELRYGIRSQRTEKKANRPSSSSHQHNRVSQRRISGEDQMASLDTRQEKFPATPRAIAKQAYLRTELERRQTRLKSALVSPLASASLATLL